MAHVTSTVQPSPRKTVTVTAHATHQRVRHDVRVVGVGVLQRGGEHRDNDEREALDLVLRGEIGVAKSVQEDAEEGPLLRHARQGRDLKPVEVLCVGVR